MFLWVCTGVSSKLPGAPDPALSRDDPGGLPRSRQGELGGCEMIQVASPAAAQFPLAVKTLLPQSLRLRDRYQQGEVSPHGLAVASGRLEVQLDRLLDRHFRCPDNQRLAKHLRHEQPRSEEHTSELQSPMYLV